jgi:formate/nitrite transporter FocA (FNT family)
MHDRASKESPTDAALSPRERRRVAQDAAPRAAIVHEIIRAEGEIELSRPLRALVWSGLAAGLSMGFSMVAQGLMEAALPDEPWRPLVSSLGYGMGFLIVVLGRQQLFTESTLTAMLPLLYRRDRATLRRVAEVWALVLVANLVGTLAFATLTATTQVFGSAAGHAFVELGRPVLEGSPGTTFVKAIFAGWLIALMVWLLPAAGAARVWIILLLTYLVALGHLAHVIAGSSEAAFAVLSGAAPWPAYLWRFLLPTLLGNVLGGVLLVGLLNHAQVAPELEATGEEGETTRPLEE